MRRNTSFQPKELQDNTIYSLYLNRPSEEYRLALNLAIQTLLSHGEDLLAVCSSEIYAMEVLKRYPRRLILSLNNITNENARLNELEQWACGPVEWLDPHNEGLANRFDALIWVEPETQAHSTFEVLNRFANPGATLAVISSGWLRRFIPEWQSLESSPARNPLAIRHTVKMLRQQGWRLIDSRGFHGWRAMTLSLVIHIANMLNQPILIDRLLQTSRAVYCEQSALWPLAPVRLLLARKSH